MSWPPKIGETLPGAGSAWCVEEKWTDWILCESGHGSEWRRVFLLERGEWRRAWEALATAVVGGLVETVRVYADGGVTCGVAVELTIGKRTATVISAWHYAGEHSPPRLVTAYPRPYNRGYASHA